jgi:hypothetical protein
MTCDIDIVGDFDISPYIDISHLSRYMSLYRNTVRFYVPQNAQNEVRYIPCCDAEEAFNT